MACEIVVQYYYALPCHVVLLLRRSDMKLHVQPLDSHLSGNDLRAGRRVRCHVIDDRHEVAIELVLLCHRYLLSGDVELGLRQEHIPVFGREEQSILLVDRLSAALHDYELPAVDQLPLFRRG